MSSEARDVENIVIRLTRNPFDFALLAHSVA